MQEFRIQNLASFMETLFSTDCFSSFLVESAQFRTAVTWDLDGSLNKRFYSVEEWNDKQQHPYTHSSWTDVRPLCRDLIAGKKAPADFRIVLLLKGEYLGCHPCVCTSSLKMKTADITEKFLPATGHEYVTVHLVGED